MSRLRICPMRSDKNQTRLCSPRNCMWGRLAFEEIDGADEIWYCAVNQPPNHGGYPNVIIDTSETEASHDQP